jgi:outer membrane protein assembly factor BamB
MRKLGIVVGVVVACIILSAADWPQWLGSERNGISHETGLRKEWPKDGPKLLWEMKEIGFGYSTPSVVGDRLYLLGNKDLDNEFVEAREVKDGSPAWSTRLGKVGEPKQAPNLPAARSTPTVVGDQLYALGSDGDLACLETATGKIVWHKNVRTDFAGKPGRWAYSESPLVDGDALVCTPGGSQATVVALNKNTGDVIWKCAVPGGDQAGYASLVMSDAAGVKQYVQFLQNGVVGVDAKTGKFLWRYDRTAKGSPANIPTPVVHDSYVYSGTGYSGAGLVKLKGDSNGVSAEQVYYDRNLPKSIGGAIYLDGNLYGTNPQGLLCVDFTTGKVRWKDKSIGAAALCYADGCLYPHGENGEVALVEATPDAYHEKGRFSPSDQPKHTQMMQKAWVYPVVANGRLYIRDWDRLWCYDVKEGK